MLTRAVYDMGAFDDLIPQQPQGQAAQAAPVSPQPQAQAPAPPSSNAFADLIPSASSSGVNVKSDAPQQSPQTFVQGLQQGAANRVLGGEQLINATGAGKYLGLPNDDVLNEAVKENNPQENSDRTWAGFAGNLAGDPLNYTPLGEAGAGIKGAALAGAKYGAASALTSGQEQTQSLGNRAENAAVDAGLGTVAGPIAGKVAATAAKPFQYLANKSGLTDALAAGANAVGSSLESSPLYQSAQNAGYKLTGKTPQQIQQSLTGWLKNQTDNIANGISNQELNPLEANFAISKSYGNALQHGNSLYDNARQLGAGKTIEAKGLLDQTDGVIQDLESNQFRTPAENRALNAIKKIRGNIGDSIEGGPTGNPNILIADEQGNTTQMFPHVPEKIQYGDLVDLNQAMNSYFKPSKFASKENVPYAALSSNVKGLLNKVSQNDPRFGLALNDANQFWKNGVPRTFKSNKVLGTYWKPDDYYAFKDLQNNPDGILPSELQKRAETLIPKIRTGADLDALTRALPQDSGDAIRAAKFRDLMNGAGIDDAGISTLMQTKPDLLKATVGNDPDTLSLLGHIQSFTDELNNRGIQNENPATRNNRLNNAVKGVWDYVAGRRMYAAKNAINAVTGKGNGATSALKTLANDLQNGRPGAQLIQNAASPLAARLTGTQIGNNEAQDFSGSDHTIQSPEQFSSPPPSYAPQQNPFSNLTPQQPQVHSDASDVLSKIKTAESSDNDNAKNPNSTASGPYQFTDGTWKALVSQYGQQLGVGVKDKNNPAAQAKMAQVYLNNNNQFLTKALGRQPTGGELYMAHFLGPTGAKNLIQNADAKTPVTYLFPPDYIRDNRRIFMDGTRPRTTGEVYNILAAKVS